MEKAEDSQAARRVTLKVTELELRSWKVAAAIRGVNMSEWIKRVLNATAEKTMKEGA